MSCDIHIYAEKKVDGREWVKIGPCFPYLYASLHEPSLERVEEGGAIYTSNPHHTDEPYTGRNYNVFAWLADVRNGGRGMPGLVTDDRIEPLSAPRGLPSDVSAAVAKIAAEWGVDGHSHSWFLLSEILGADTSATITHRGVVRLAEFSEFKRSGHPPSWSGGVWGPRVRIVSNDEMEKMLESPPDNGLSYYTQIEWQQPLSGALYEFMESMSRLSLFGTDDIRIVFWFDN